MKRSVKLLFLILVCLLIGVWTGCGSSRTAVDQTGSEQSGQGDDFDEIEKLLGISREDDASSKEAKPQPSKKEKKEDDLITLLEADEGKNKEITASQTTPAGDQRVVRMQAEVDELQKQIKKKDMEIADLRAQLMMKDEELKNKAASSTANYAYTAPPPARTSTGNISSDAYVNRYNSALSMFHGREYQNAIADFEELLASDINHSYSDNAQYWIGECYYAMGRYREAIMAFEKVFTFPQSNKNDYAQFKIGQCYFKLGESERARQEFQQLIDSYPDSELAPRARQYLAQS
jgi:tol-pal system protein YbgF